MEEKNFTTESSGTLLAMEYEPDFETVLTVALFAKIFPKRENKTEE